MITYAKFLGTTNSYVTGTVWPLVKLDLDYVAQYWNSTGTYFVFRFENPR
jgi:glucoamylase